jgi:hypothetical protein
MKIKIITRDIEYPEVGDLIASDNTMDMVNIVLEVSELQKNEHGHEFKYVRSVRYGETNKGNFKWLNGKRSRWFKWYGDFMHSHRYKDWRRVELFAKFDDEMIRQQVLRELANVNTSYKGVG